MKKALVINAKDDVKAIVNAYIAQLPSQAYTEQNINALSTSLSQQCSVSTLLFCFDCIATLPSMTEIQVTVTSTQPTVSKVLDISYTPANNMTCVGVHE